MNRECLDGIRMQLGGTLQEQWGRLTRDPLAAAAGRNTRFAGRILEMRGRSAQESERQLSAFMRRHRNWWDLSGR